MASEAQRALIRIAANYAAAVAAIPTHLAFGLSGVAAPVVASIG